MPPASVKELLAQSKLAFSGTVEQAGATTVPDIPVDDRTVVVLVGEVLHAPPAVDLEAGARVTVQLVADLPALSAGDEATFFANGLAYGEGLAVAEVGRSTAAQTAAPTARLAGLETGVTPVRAAMAELAQDEVVEHARGADAIVRAQVTGLNMVATTRAPHEHDPQYWIATLRVDLVAKGDVAAGDSVAVLYANSLDVSVRHRPKPKAGQGGLWMLHLTSDPELAALAPFELLDPLDLQDSILLDVLGEQGL